MKYVLSICGHCRRMNKAAARVGVVHPAMRNRCVEGMGVTRAQIAGVIV